MNRAIRGRSAWVAALTLCSFAVVPHAVAAAPASAAPAAPEIRIVSTRAEYVSGGDVLVEVRTHDQGAAKHLRIEVDDRDVLSSFREMPDGSRLGLLTGLSVGSHTIVARANGSGNGSPPGRTAVLDIVNHPITGPLLSGPQQQPFFCETAQAGLGPPTDAACSAPTQISYRYRTTAGAFQPLADPTVRPADLAQTTTIDGRTVDYIVRLERGTIDRAIYEIAALHDPSSLPSPFTAEPGWNERLVYTFGGGCNVGYHQGTGTGGVLNDLFLSRGYAVASSSLNVYETNCSEVISAEAALMVKEHFIETYGAARYTIGWGGSGGAIQQHLIANNYPGILDGIVPAASFQDSLTLGTVPDCRLLALYFASPAGIAAGWTADQQAAASGYGSFNSCNLWHLAFASRTNALEACPTAIPVSARYHPVTNPSGIRCTSFEQIATQLGRNSSNGFAWRPLDNIGVEYGLTALQSGAISAEQFVSLNEHAGGFDVIGQVIPERVAADPIGVQRSYQTGRVNTGGLGLSSTPIIDARTYTDFAPPFGGDIHTRFHSFVVRQRLLDANGTAANQVIFISNPSGSGAMQTEALTRMEAWLAAIHADDAPGSAAERVIRNRPTDLSDACWTSPTTRIDEQFEYQIDGVCEGLYPSYGDTRTAAGGGLAGDTLKCQLQPLDFAAYPVTFTPDQHARLQAAFPTGVCDWSKPGVDAQPPLGTWLDYGT